MAENRIYLTVSPDKRPDGYVAVLSRGQPQFGDEEVTVLSVTVVPNMKAAKTWKREMLEARPWETRQ